MDKLVELIGKILEKLTSAKLLWTLLIAIAIFALTFVLIPGTSAKALSLNCLKDANAGCTPAQTVIGIAALAAISLILSSIIIWVVGFIRQKYFV